MNNYKKIIAGLMAAVMLCSFAACSKDNESSENSSEVTTEATTTASAEETTEDTTEKDKEYLKGTTNMDYTDALTAENTPVIMKINGMEVSYDEYVCLFLNLKDDLAKTDESYWTGTAYADFTAEDDLKIKNEKLKENIITYLKKYYVVDTLAKENNVALDDADNEEINQYLADTDKYYEDNYYAGAYKEFLDKTYRTEAEFRRETAREVLENKLVKALYEQKFRDNEFKSYIRMLQIYFMPNLEYLADDEGNPTDNIKPPYEFLEGHTYTDEEKALVEAVNAAAQQSQPSDTTPLKEALLKLAEYVKSQIKTGEDYIEYMQKYNKDNTVTGKNEKGEYVGLYLPKGANTGEFENVAYALEENEISEIITTDAGYHIVERLPMDEEYLKDYIVNLFMMDASYSYNGDYSKLCNAELSDIQVEYLDCYDNININSIKWPSSPVAQTSENSETAE